MIYPDYHLHTDSSPDGHASAAVIFLILRLCGCSHTEGHINQRKDDRISDRDRVSDYRLGRNKILHSFK